MRVRRSPRSNWVIWTANLDRKFSRRMGRKIPKRLAIPGVRLNELIEACSSLNLRFIAENKKYPRCWWDEGGRVLVEKSKPKPELMREIAIKIAEIRRKREEEKRRKGKKKR